MRTRRTLLNDAYNNQLNGNFSVVVTSVGNQAHYTSWQFAILGEENERLHSETCPFDTWIEQKRQAFYD